MLDFLFNPNGRVSRGGMWLGLFLPQLALGFGAAMIDAASMGSAITKGELPSAGLASSLVSLVFLWPNIAVPVKRFHDRGMSGWWVLWFILIVAAGVVFAFMGGAAAAASTGKVGSGALIGFVIVAAAALAQFVILYLLPGQPGGNQYGPDPRDGSGRVHTESKTTSEWADSLDPARLSAAVSGSGAATKRQSASVAPRGPRTVNWPNGAGARSSFGRRGA